MIKFRKYLGTIPYHMGLLFVFVGLLIELGWKEATMVVIRGNKIIRKSKGSQ